MMMALVSILSLLLLLGRVDSFAASSAIRTAAATATKVETKPWQFQGHDIYTEVVAPTTTTAAASSKPSQNNLPAVLLIHGFGCSTVYWRETKAVLAAAGYQVHALDLLGQGQSAKPGREQDGIEYSIPLWAAQCSAYIDENICLETNNGVVLMGNSLGSLVALSAATGDFVQHFAADSSSSTHTSSLQQRCKGIGMFNCGIGLNSSGIAKEPQWNPLQRWALNTLFATLNVLIFENLALLQYLLDEVVTRERLRDALQSLYIYDSAARVDDVLVESFYRPAQQAGAAEALSQIYTNDPGATPMDMFQGHDAYLTNLPIHLVWGTDDVVTPVEGGVGQFYTQQATCEDNSISMEMIANCGHVPFDDRHVESNASMLKWLQTISS